MAVDTPGGRIHVQWDHAASATPNAQLTFFAELLATTGVYDAWVNTCPLIYTSPNAPSKRDVLGTWLLAILAGHKRYAHITGLMGVLDKLDAPQRPALVRGDSGFGNEPFIAELEERAQPYLFKLRQTAGVKKLLTRQFARDDWSLPGPSDQGWSAVEDTLKLSGWDKARRVVILRRRLKTDLALSRKTSTEVGEQIELLMPDKDVQAWEYAVLVTNSTYALDAYGQLYRDRADCENGFDELKNQWGWGGFTTQDIERCQTSARAVALVYNWWSWYSRAAKPGARMEAITSRALLLASVGRAVKHAGQTTLYLTPMHAAKDKLLALITNIRAALSHVKVVAEQLPQADRWKTFLDYVVAKITRPLSPWHRTDQLAMAG
jgi:hypothetical protein